MVQFDFDNFKNLYIEDPAKFEKITRGMIEDAIDNARPESIGQLRAKQWRLDQELEKIKDPVERMNRMVVIFWEGVYDFKRVLTNPKESLKPSEESEPCNIIEFKNKTQRA